MRLHWRSIVTAGRWKLNLCIGDQCELFALDSDPHEEINLYKDTVHKVGVWIMAALVRQWQEETWDDDPLPSV